MAIPDLALLGELSVESILSVLQERYKKDDIYTYVGDILIAVNPYKILPIVAPEVQAKYLRCQRADHDPHIYYLAYNAYETMLRTRQNQAFVISGESGSGKTESTKLVVNHVIELCKASNKELESRITQLNPLIEAFGNAKTVMNNNSSRFGKFLDLKFDRTGAVTGAEISEYLLEKSRVTSQAPGEQNYHIFYILLAAAGIDKGFGLGKPSEHPYVVSEGGPADGELLTEENAAAMPHLLSTFGKMGFDPKDVDSMQRVLAALLHIGNVQFGSDKDDFAMIAGDAAPLQRVAELLKVDPAGLQAALLSTTTQAGGEMMTRKYTADVARETRDSLARALYARMFGWLITCCNTNLADGSETATYDHSLGILDIFGFEDFAVNQLEQLCINITNEQLQFFFNQHIFAMEQKEYAAEGIDVAAIDFVDNQPTLDMLLGKPRGVLAMLDEESRFPKATDLTYTRRVATDLGPHKSEAFKPPQSDKDLYFSVVHYAGAVKYTTDGFLNKNRDALPQDVVAALRFSEDDLIGSLWAARKTGTGTFRTVRAARDAHATSKRKAPATVGSQFSNSLEDLMRRISESNPHFIRCIKPNSKKAVASWEQPLVERQLRYCGVLETVQIRKMGYSVREPLAVFVNRYGPIALSESTPPDPTQANCKLIMDAVGITDFKFGKEKIFMKYHHPEALTAALRKQRKARQFVERVCRGFVCRVRYRHLLEQKAEQTVFVQGFFQGAEDGCAAARSTVVQLDALDHAAAEKRKWLKSIQRKKEKAEKERLKKEKEEEKKRLEEEERLKKEEQKKFKATKTRGKVVNGNHVFVRNEQLTKRVGKLESHWEKKLDPKTGRFYFKNHKTRQTTWIDPRTEKTRKKDAKDCADDELPYGWDEAEVDGDVYFIDHINRKTHWLHPKLLLDEMRQDYVGKEEEVQARANVIRAVIKQHREKRRRLEELKAEASQADLPSLQQRIEAMDVIIERELANLKAVTSENQVLRAEIRELKNAFGKADYANNHGGDASGFAEGDVLDLYALDRKAQESLPARLDTLTRNQLRQMSGERRDDETE
mmetsp:Transcript_6068/g.15483  ORF Transcript_6068/g.15483 Transcript_6068/m.15483 type:complete len:1057 (+) Transcript_6068:245-3415(+)|eukprot:CAMPEP_0182928650 /NCGR_PEP_ID=MMETSP0105_2-20130417/15691_1 /TAXON_ID=81532 ORGANISM="Acanthoeca-like sp., Strain 10tr" /NCGR_SAMPLE_ID=MMETSP0105_2 /ASSEMBLY_ACC=CAM_ASM_000205 /LENGTH=1056 /DNA_ID=CAMNT_0025066655 /DNA_START=245 /DNA_END=3415 /DNA_ORIENTATION=+